jgi:hypothetical protein
MGQPLPAYLLAPGSSKRHNFALSQLVDLSAAANLESPLSWANPVMHFSRFRLDTLATELSRECLTPFGLKS